MDPSFTDEEKRFVLAEMIKTSHLDVLDLAHFITAHEIEPEWMQMQLPLGRNMNQCLQVAHYMGVPSSGQKRKSSHDHIEQSAKRTAFPEQRESSTAVSLLSSAASTVPTPRAILPRPISVKGVDNVSPQPQAQPLTLSQPPRKRGRPSRLERSKNLRPPVLPQIAPRPEQSSAPVTLQPQPMPPYLDSSSALDPATRYSTSSDQAELRRSERRGRPQQDATGPLAADSPRQVDPELSHIATPRVMPEGTPGHFKRKREFTSPGLVPLEPKPRARTSSRGSHDSFTTTLPPLKREDKLAPMDSSRGGAQAPLANSA